ncbi:MAG: hypothetical protein IPM45_15200 [Acidimicrobiales bacterium]|nr:hypothetical protein [Acidimicrobiales bacterium]
MHPIPPAAELWRRVPRLVLGLVLMGVGIALTVRADLGLGPWDVLHQGVAERTGLPIGWTSILVGVVVLALWVPLRERVGLGTILNAVIVGLVIDAALALLPGLHGPTPKVTALLLGLGLIAAGSGLYIGSGLGAGPRDGLMTAIVRRGHPVWSVRTAIEVTVLGAGFLLGGAVGLGTVLTAFGIGPLVQLSLGRLSLPPLEPIPAPAPAVSTGSGRA